MLQTTHLRKAFKFQVCDKSFTRMNALIRHGQQDRQLVTHRCDKCLKEFYRRDKLVEHRVVCNGNTLKRKSDDPVDTTSEANRSKVDETAHPSDQIGYGDDDPCNLTSAFENNLKKIELKSRKDQKHDMSQFLRGNSKPILIHLSKELEMNKGLKWFISVKARFVKPKVDGEDLFSEPHFHSLCTTTVNAHDMEKQLKEACSKILDSLAIYQKEGSVWILDEILHLDLNMAKYTPLKGSSYIPLPKKLKTKKAIINIKNSDKCFMWSILAALHPAAKHVDRQSHYMQFEHELDFSGIEFPVTIDKIGKFECQNNISVNVFGFPYYYNLFNLLLYSQGTTRHYSLIKDLNKLLYDQNGHKCRMYYCRYCLHGLIRVDILQDHELHCCQHGAQRIELRSEYNASFYFKDYHKQLQVPFVIYADF